MCIYRSYGALSYLDDESGRLTYANLSFASMGFATNNCGKAPIDWEAGTPTILFFQCQRGFGVTEVLSTGILDTSKIENAGINKCYISDEPDDIDFDLNPEWEYFDREEMSLEILSTCFGQESCRAEIPISHSTLSKIPESIRSTHKS